jgi:hypothetical protein
MARAERPALTGACGCSTPWVAGLGACCAKRLELVVDFNAELELTQKAASDATYGDTTYGIVHSPPPVSIPRRYVVLGDNSPPLEAPGSPESSGSSRRLLKDERGSDGMLRQDMDVYQLELQRKLELQLVRERGANDEDRPGYTSLYGTLPKDPVPQEDMGFNSKRELALDCTPPPARVRRADVPDSPGFDVVRQQAPPEAQQLRNAYIAAANSAPPEATQLRDAYIAAANGNSAPLEVLRAAAAWCGEAEAAPPATKPRGNPRRSKSDSALVSRGLDRLHPAGGRTAVWRGMRHCRHVPLGRRRAVLQRECTNNLLVRVMCGLDFMLTDCAWCLQARYTRSHRQGWKPSRTETAGMSIMPRF